MEMNFTENEIENFRYGDKRYTEYLDYIASCGDFVPINELFNWSKFKFIESAGEDAQFIIGNTGGMAVSDASTDEEALAGYILTFTIVIRKCSSVTEEDISKSALIQLLENIYEKVIHRSPWLLYQVENYFNNHPGMIGGCSGMPQGRNSDA